MPFPFFSEATTFIRILPRSRKEMLYCRFCSYSSIFAHSVKTHERIHTGERPFKCTVCHAGFTQKQHLVAHVRMHTGDKMFRCNLCRCAYAEEHYLAAHMETHLGERPFPCELCPKRFRDRWSLDRHQQPSVDTKNSSVPRKFYRCKYCLFRTSNISSFNIHRDTHGGNDERLPVPVSSIKQEPESYSCHLCAAAFQTQDVLQVHLQKHITSSHLYHCSVCDAVFGNVEMRDEHMVVHTKEKVYKCTVCSRHFFKRYLLSIHMRTHTGEKPYPCKICSKQFSIGSNRDRHVRLVHGPGSKSRRLV
ncbi:zinc finger protein 454-like [Ornithodoros turicata]|uniref:zinc finger protein 454-like n=1 Tax=Ornithodoros turicata TaxID=34597 RepID=UPI003139408C